MAPRYKYGYQVPRDYQHAKENWIYRMAIPHGRMWLTLTCLNLRNMTPLRILATRQVHHLDTWRFAHIWSVTSSMMDNTTRPAWLLMGISQQFLWRVYTLVLFCSENCILLFFLGNSTTLRHGPTIIAICILKQKPSRKCTSRLGPNLVNMKGILLSFLRHSTDSRLQMPIGKSI